MSQLDALPLRPPAPGVGLRWFLTCLHQVAARRCSELDISGLNTTELYQVVITSGEIYEVSLSSVLHQKDERPSGLVNSCLLPVSATSDDNVIN